MADILRVAEIPTLGGGLIGVTFAPGKEQVSLRGNRHERDLAADLDTISEWNAAAVLTLVKAFELRQLGIPALGKEVRARFIEWHHHPIQDGGIPDAAFELRWPETSRRLRLLLTAGNRVLIHCMGGLGRAGMIAARLLAETGIDPDEAIRSVRNARPGAIETLAQETWVRYGTRMDAAIPRTLAGYRDRALGALLGLAVGDAVGTTIEFSAKPDRALLNDMVGGGPFGLEAGQWTDDTAMALALADSLLSCPDLDPTDLMKRFLEWHRSGRYSCTGSCFDIGMTTAAALRHFERTGNPFAGSTDPMSAGNGSIMRLAPVVIRHWRDRALMLRIARDQSRTTHAADEAVEACASLAGIIAAGIGGSILPEIVTGPLAGAVRGFRPGQHRREVRGTGYVVASLHAALWAVARTSSFQDAILLAANLGEDADTTAAVAGQIAGAVYGMSGIPQDWLLRLAWRERIEGLAGGLFEAGELRAAA